MYFKQMLDERHGCASYLIACRASGEAAVVDPPLRTDEIDETLRERGYRLRLVVDTHVHADHVSGARALAAHHGATLALHEAAPVAYPFRPLRDGDELALGRLRLGVLHTPGHRPELISLLVTNPARCPKPSMVLTGDSLLVGDAGRPDFGGGDAAAQFASLHHLLALPDWVAVFPGHFEGPCGAGMCGRPSTTVGFERRFNPLAGLDEAAFVTRLEGSVPPRPLNMAAIEATNRGAADLAWAMPTGAAAAPEVTLDLIPEAGPEGFVLDVREPGEYAAGHLPGAVNLPQAELATRLDELPRNRAILCVCQSGRRSLAAAAFLLEVGFGEVASLAGGTAGWIAGRQPVEVWPAAVLVGG